MPYVDNPFNPTGTPDYIWEQDNPGGGGGAEPTISITFAESGRGATSDGVSVNIDTLLGNDPNLAGWWGGDTSIYDPGLLTVDGYAVQDATALALIGDARAAVLAGATLLARFADGSSGLLAFIVTSADGAAYIIAGETTFPNGVLIEGPSGEFASGEAAGVDKFAVTFAPTKVSASIAGSDVATSALTETDWPPTMAAVALYSSENPPTLILAQLDIYVPALNDATLPTVSAP